jgi:anthranilate/para-aminobenzoate synthase component I
MIVRTQRIHDLSADDVMRRLVSAAPGDVVWLDSAVGDPERGQRSLLAWELDAVASIALHDSSSDTGALWASLDRQFALDAAAAQHTPDLGWVGVIRYEAARLADAGMPELPTDGPLVEVCAVRAGAVHDADGIRLVAHGTTAEQADASIAAMRQALATPPPPMPTPRLALQTDLRAQRAWHAAAVSTILHAIDEGRVYQACLTFPLWFAPLPSLLPAYLALRSASPGDFGAYVRLGDLTLASSSPERFLSVDGRRVWSRPMKGTRPRGASAAEDAAARAALTTSEKDRAENVMIVDLVRNDLGRVCEIGSVAVPELYAIESYETVHQMTSTIEGRLRDAIGPFGLLAAAFPPGSMTGAPKIAACTLLAGLESAPRQAYSGTIMALGYDGRHTMSVVIRTLQQVGGRLRYDVGGGIVADSTPDAEWDEALAKAAALTRAGLLDAIDDHPQVADRGGDLNTDR